MTFDFFEILLLSTIQGISEFIPVSSSAHLFLISDFYNFKVQSLFTDIGLHLGSLLAIITYFHSDLSNIFKNKNCVKKKLKTVLKIKTNKKRKFKK